MKEIKAIVNLYQSSKSTSVKSAIAQVVRVEGSSYRREGARMLVFESGVFEGGISGGCLEGDALKRSQLAILKQKSSIVTYDTSKDDEHQIGIGLGCNGIIDVLITPITETNNLISLLEKCIQHRKSHILVTVIALEGTASHIELGSMFYYDTEQNRVEACADEDLENAINLNATTVLSQEKSGAFFTKGQNYEAHLYIEFIPPQFHLAIYGDNYDVYPMIDFAKTLDWEVSLKGNVQKLKKEKLAYVDHLYLKESTNSPQIDYRTAVVLMAHDFKTDVSNLYSTIHSDAPYIAALGPKKRFLKMLDALKENQLKLTATQLERIHAPCGLEIGANTPEEIALSIFSEILGVFRAKDGRKLKLKEGPIHE